MAAAIAGAPLLVFIAYPMPIPLVPTIGADLGIGVVDLQLAVGAFPLGLGAALLAGGVLSDRFGGTRVWLASTLAFAIFALGCALSFSGPQLIAWRLAQGLAGAAMLACSLKLVSTAVPPERRAKVTAWWGAAIGGGLSIGPLLGAVIVEFGQWRPAFAAVGVLAAIAVTLAYRILPRVGPDPAAGTRRLDVVGTVALALGLGSVILAINRVAAPGGLGVALTCAAVGVVLLVGFVVLQRRRAQPMVDVEQLRVRGYGVGLLAGAALAASILSLMVVYGSYLQDVAGLSPLATSLWFLAWALTAFLVALHAARISGRLSLRTRLVMGLGLAGVGLLLLLPLSYDTSPAWLLPGFLISGVGVGLCNPALGAAAVTGIAPAHSGMAAGAANTARQLGNAVGIAGLAALVQAVAAASMAGSARPEDPAGLVDDLSRGDLAGALAALPAQRHDAVRALYETAQTSGVHVAVAVAAAIALVGALGVLLVSRRADGRAAPTPGTVGDLPTTAGRTRERSTR